MQTGGSDPAIVARMIDLQAEAQSQEKNQPAAAGKSETQSDDVKHAAPVAVQVCVNTAVLTGAFVKFSLLDSSTLKTEFLHGH